MSCFRNKHIVIEDEIIILPNVPATDNCVKTRPSKVPVRVVQSADSGLSSIPPLINALNEDANGRVSVNPKIAKKAVKQREANVTPPNPLKARRAWNGSTRVPENLKQVLPSLAEQAAGARPVSATHVATASDRLRVPTTPSKPVGTGIGRRSSSGSLIPVRIPPSRFSSSTVNDASLKQTSKNEAIFKPVKAFFKRVGRKLSGKDKKEKKAIINALSAPIETAPEKAQSIVLEIRIDEEVVSRPANEVISETRDILTIPRDQAHARVSVPREAILEGLVEKCCVETSGNRAKIQKIGQVYDSGLVDQVAPFSNRSVYDHTTLATEPPNIKRHGVLSVSTSSSSSSDIKVPTNAELQAMADALSPVNQSATPRDRATRRRTMHIAPSVAPKANKETESPSYSSSCCSVKVPTDSQLQAMETLLCANQASSKPAPVRRRQFTRRAPTAAISAATEVLPVSVPWSGLKPTLEDARLQVLVDVTAHESATSAAPSEESTVVAIVPSSDVVEPFTSSSDIEVPSDFQLHLMEGLLCGSDKAPSFSDSGIALVVPSLPNTKDASSISVSSSNFLVPTDSQMQLMEDLLCGKMLFDSAPLTGLSTAAIGKQDGVAAGTSSSHLDIPSNICTQVVADDHAFDICTPLAYGANSADSVSVESSDVAVPTEADLIAMEDLLCGASLSAGAAQGSPDSVAAFSPAHGSEFGSETSSEIMAPTNAVIHAMELALVSWGGSGSSATEDESNSDTGSSTDSTNSSPLLGTTEHAMLSAAGRAATARRSANRNARQTGSYDPQPKRSAIRKEPDIVEVDRATGLPVKSDWREVHFPEKEVVQIATIPREPATVDMSYIVPDPDPVQMTADKVFLNTACLVPRTDVPGMRLDRVFPVLNITSPRPDNAPPTPYRPSPNDQKGSLLPEPKVDSPLEDAPRRSPWANHNRFFDYEARVKCDPYTLGEHKELVLWRNRHRFARRTSVYLPGVPFIIRDSKNVLMRASRALGDHICKLGLNKPRELPIQMPVRTAMIHNAHFLRHTEAEDCPCGKSRKARRIDGWFKPTNVSAYAINEASQYAEDGLRDPETDSDSDDSYTNKSSVAHTRTRVNRVADSLLTCGAYRARQLAHPLITEYSHLYDLHPRRIYVSSATTSKASGSVSASYPGSVSVSHLDNVPPALELSHPDHVVPQLIVTCPSSLSLAISASCSNSIVSGLHPTRPWIPSEHRSSLHVSSSVNSVASSSSVYSKAVSRKASSVGRLFAPSHGVSADAHANHLDIASQKVSGESSHHIIELSSDVLQDPRPSGGPHVSLTLPLCSATSGFARRPDPSGSISELAPNALGLSSKPAESLRMPSTMIRGGSVAVPFLRAVTSRALLLPKPSLNDLSRHQP